MSGVIRSAFRKLSSLSILPSWGASDSAPGGVIDFAGEAEGQASSSPFDVGGHDSRGVANLFVVKALADGKDLPILSLLKFVYLAHGWTLGYLGRPLVCHKVRAWEVGPVIREVYGAFRGNDPYAVRSKAAPYYLGIGPGPFYHADLDAEEKKIVNNVYNSYSGLMTDLLSNVTHPENSPWSKAYVEGGSEVIPNEEIAKYYKGLAGTS